VALVDFALVAIAEERVELWDQATLLVDEVGSFLYPKR
jgi:hypothetical protein